MEKYELDLLYHHLRVASNDADHQDTGAGLTPAEVGDRIFGLCRHLLAGGDYDALVRFNEYYGTKFLLPQVVTAIQNSGWKFDRVVELGAGLGWLGRGLAAETGFKPALFIDKRPWVLIDIVTDLESAAGLDRVLGRLKPRDLIIMADLLHCLEEPRRLIDQLAGWKLVILEYCPSSPRLRQSFTCQIARYGAKALSADDLDYITSKGGRLVGGLEPYVLFLVEA